MDDRPSTAIATDHDGVMVADTPEDDLLAEDVLVEEVSIDGMFGVY